MWIYTKDAFVSVVEDRHDPETLIVRSRVSGDIEAVWPDAEVIHTPVMADYAYRTRLNQQEVTAGIAKQVLKIDYANFKDSITDKRRSPFYMRVWHAMWDLQHNPVIPESGR